MSEQEPILDARALRRLGIAVVIDGVGYKIGHASGALAAYLQPIDQPSAAQPAYLLPVNQPSAAIVVRVPQMAPCCADCGDVLPDGARFCITCGATVSATGKTERL